MNKSGADKLSVHSSAGEDQKNEVKQNFQTSSLPSQFFQTYQKQFNLPMNPRAEEVSQKILSSGRFQLKSSWVEEITQNFISTDSESISLEIHYGYYGLKIDIITVKLDCKFEDEIMIGKGQFGTVYEILYGNQSIAVKDVSLRLQDSVESIKRVYREYFIASIASQLGIGPKVLNVFGYDIVFINNHAFFAMEKCLEFEPSTKKKGKREAKLQQLSASLNQLHLLNIVHRDVKPCNIFWSPAYRKHVFIDFGLSTLLSQPIGCKTFSIFVGTYAYSYHELRKLYTLRKAGYVDFYFNDMNGLKMSLEHLSRQEVIHRFNSLQLEQQFEMIKSHKSLLSDFIPIFNIKRLCFLNEKRLVIEKIGSMNKMYFSLLEIINREIETNIVPCKFKDKWMKMKDEIYEKAKKQNYKISKSDQLMSTYLKNLGSGSLINHLVPFRFILYKQKFNMKEILKDKEWIERLFSIIDPSIEVYSFYRNSKYFIENTHCAINLIYSQIGGEETTLFVKKIRKIFLFFYQKFREFKDKRSLMRLADIFIGISDRLNATKVQYSIIQLVKDPLEYCLLNLNFYMTCQHATSFNLPKEEVCFLRNILSFQLKKQEKYKRLQELELLRRIGRDFDELLSSQNCYYEAEFLYYKFSAIYENFINLEAKLANSEHIQLISQTIKFFMKIYANFLVKALQNKINVIYGHSVEDLLMKLKQKSRSSLAEKNMIEKANISFHVIARLDLGIINILEKTTKFERLVEICEFYFEVCGGKTSSINMKFWNILNEHLTRDINFAVYVLNLKAKWLELNVSSVSSYNSYYVELRQMLDIATKLAFQKSISQGKNEKQLVECKTNIFKIVKHYEREIKKHIKSHSQFLVALQIVSIIESIETFIKGNDKQTLKKIQDISLNMRNEVLCRCQLMEFTMNRIGFIAVLANLRRSKVFIEESSFAKLDEEIITIWEATQFPVGAITSNYILEELIKIYHSRLKYSVTYTLLCRIIQIVGFNPKIYSDSKAIVPLRQSFNYFSSTTPPKVLVGLIEHLIDMKGFALIIKDKETMLFLFRMFEICFEQASQNLLDKVLFYIANGMPFMDPYSYILVRSKYFSIFAVHFKGNKRKTLILERIYSRVSFKSKQKKWLKLARLLSQRANGLKQRIKQKLRSKIQRLFD